MEYATLFAVTALGVATKAWQQLNVQHHRMGWVPPASYVMATTEILIISQIAISGANIYGMILGMGTGGWVGCLIAMHLHARARNGKAHTH